MEIMTYSTKNALAMGDYIINKEKHIKHRSKSPFVSECEW